MLHIPAGVVHRVSLDEGWYVRAQGFYRSYGFGDELVPIFDIDETHPIRQAHRSYISSSRTHATNPNIHQEVR